MSAAYFYKLKSKTNVTDICNSEKDAIMHTSYFSYKMMKGYKKLFISYFLLIKTM